MDETQRDLLRQWRASPGDGELRDRALQAWQRAGQRDLPIDLVLSQERWQRLDGFVRKWFAVPLGQGEDVSTEALDQAETRLGARFPTAYREAYRLLAHREDVVQDDHYKWRVITPLEELELHEGVLPLIKGLFRFGPRLPDEGVEDPHTVEVVGGNVGVRHHPPLSTFVLAWVLTQNAYARPERDKPWAKLRRGASGATGTLERKVLQRHYNQLPFRAIDTMSKAELYGDADTVILQGRVNRIVGRLHTTLAMTRTKAALERLMEIGGSDMHGWGTLKPLPPDPPRRWSAADWGGAHDFIGRSGKYKSLD